MAALWFMLLTSCVFLKCTPAEAKCESEWKEFSDSKSGRQYLFKRFCNATFDGAEKICRAEHGHLASIHSEEENKFIRDVIGPQDKYHDEDVYLSYNDYVWIGAKKINDDHYEWTDGTSMTFTKWSAGEPNNKYNEEGCAQMYTRAVSDSTVGEGDSYWNDVLCERVMRYFVCKKSVKR